MPQTMEVDNAFVSRLAQLDSAAGDWLLPIRKEAAARFTEAGFPTTKHEEWTCTNVSAVASTDFEPAGDTPEIAADRYAPFLFDSDERCRLTFVDGRFVPSLSRTEDLPAGVELMSLAQGLETRQSALEPYLARVAPEVDRPFTWLNTALIQDGAVLLVSRGTAMEGVIHLLFLTTDTDRPVAVHPHNIIIAGEESQLTVVETYAGCGSGRYLSNPVTELVAMENAVVDHYKVQRESSQTYHMAALGIRQARNSNVRSHTISLGGAIARNDIDTLLDGTGCECTLNGLYMLRGKQHVDNHLRVEHAKPNCDSREFFKGILDDESHGVFCGTIFVHKDAQKTDAKQTNMNLLLSEHALADSKPQLEIFANDVKCTHGATIGQVNNDAVFYMRSRGLTEDAARNMLVYAFANEIIAGVRVEALRDQLNELVSARLPHGPAHRGAV